MTALRNAWQAARPRNLGELICMLIAIIVLPIVWFGPAVLVMVGGGK